MSLGLRVRKEGNDRIDYLILISEIFGDTNSCSHQKSWNCRKSLVNKFVRIFCFGTFIYEEYVSFPAGKNIFKSKDSWLRDLDLGLRFKSSYWHCRLSDCLPAAAKRLYRLSWLYMHELPLFLGRVMYIICTVFFSFFCNSLNLKIASVPCFLLILQLLLAH